jgi:adenylate cyclase
MAPDYRRFATSIARDVTGRSRLMGDDLNHTLAVLEPSLRELIGSKFAEYECRIVDKVTGDGLLRELSGGVDALRGVAEVPRGMAERTPDVAPNERFDFRLGISIGNIIIVIARA